MQPLLLRPGEVAKLIGVSRSTVYQLIATGRLPAIYIGRSVRVPRQALEEMIDQQLEQRGQDSEVVALFSGDRSA